MAGRPRKRSLDESVDAALTVFWAKGYESTSIADLSQALGVGPSSIYNAFGSKADLYRRCLVAYAARDGASLVEQLATGDAVDGILAMLRQAVENYCRPGTPPGCAVLEADVADDPSGELGRFVAELRARSSEGLEARLREGVDDGLLREDTDVAGVARFIQGVLFGLSAQSRAGATRDELLASLVPVEVALQSYRAG